MSSAETSRNIFACTPCREIIQFFNVGVTEDHTRRFGAGVILQAPATEMRP
jgi:hypothetical protein